MGAKKEIKRLEEWEQHSELILAMVRIKIHREREAWAGRRKCKGGIEPMPVQFLEVTPGKVAKPIKRALC